MPDIVRIMGLDLSYTGSGVARPDGFTDLISTKPDATTEGRIKRVQYIARKIRGIIRATSTTHVIVEDFAYGRAMQAHQMGGLGYVVRLMLLEAGIPWVEVNVGALKKFATDNGNANKLQMVLAARIAFGYPGEDDNEADAWLLRMMGEASLGRIDNLPKYRALAVSRVDWPWDVAKLV